MIIFDATSRNLVRYDTEHEYRDRGGQKNEWLDAHSLVGERVLVEVDAEETDVDGRIQNAVEEWYENHRARDKSRHGDVIVVQDVVYDTGEITLSCRLHTRRLPCVEQVIELVTMFSTKDGELFVDELDTIRRSLVLVDDELEPEMPLETALRMLEHEEALVNFSAEDFDPDDEVVDGRATMSDDAEGVDASLIRLGQWRNTEPDEADESIGYLLLVRNIHTSTKKTFQALGAKKAPPLALKVTDLVKGSKTKAHAMEQADKYDGNGLFTDGYLKKLFARALQVTHDEVYKSDDEASEAKEESEVATSREESEEAKSEPKKEEEPKSGWSILEMLTGGPKGKEA